VWEYGRVRAEGDYGWAVEEGLGVGWCGLFFDAWEAFWGDYMEVEVCWESGRVDGKGYVATWAWHAGLWMGMDGFGVSGMVGL
jgi:hypothetical protein